MHKKKHLKSPTREEGRGGGTFLREPGAQQQVSAKTLWFLSRAGDAAGGRAHLEVGEDALRFNEEEEEGKDHIKGKGGSV